MSRYRLVQILFATCLSASAQETRLVKPLPDFDVRTAAAQPTAALTAEASRRPLAAVDVAGQPVLYSLDAAGLPKAISSNAGLTAPSNEQPESIARAYLRSNGGVLPFSAADASAMRLRQSVSAGDLRVLYFQQYAGGLPVHGSSVKTAIDAAGRIRSASLVGAAPGVRLRDAVPSLDAAQAARLALESLQVEVSGPLQSLPASNGRLLFAHPEGGRRLPVAAELAAFAMPVGEARLAWRIFADAGQGSYEVLLSAADGQLLLRQNVAADLGAGRVFAVTPLQPSEIRQFADGWLAPEATVTTGNNVDAYADADSNDTPDEFETPGLVNGRASSATQMFDFDPGTGSNASRLTRAAAVTNAFYHGNQAHDFFYKLGFREAEGNFQQSNLDRGGLGEDAMRIEVHDLVVLNNARYLGRPDGLAPRIEMGLWTRTPGSLRDMALDAPVVMHEYAHGVTSRAVGGPDNVSCLFGTQPGALSEGWSDYFAASFYNATVLGDYITGDLTNGLRGAAIDKNTRNYADLGLPIFEVHHDGATWASLLWDIRTAIGAEAADALIVRALALTACNPTYVDARDAIVAADGGTFRTQLWTVFAARGLGSAASAFHSDLAVGTVFNANFDLPPDIAPGNRAPNVTSRPSAPATFGRPYSYVVRSLDPDDDARTYQLVSGPPGVQVDAATGEMTWPSPTFTTHRIQIAVTDGRGGRTVHGFQLRVEADLTPGQPITISGAGGSLGLAFVTVPPDTDILQVRLRGGNGDADLVLFSPTFDSEFSFLDGSNETLSIRDPAPGEWVARVDGTRAYRDISLRADLLTPTEIVAPGQVTGLSEGETGELFYKLTVPAATPLLRVTLTGAGDADLLLARGRIPICALGDVSLPCDEDESALAFGSYERVALENPEPGDYFLTVYGFTAFQDVTLRVAFTAPASVPTAATDGAAFQLMNAPGGIATLFGSNLADTTASAQTLPLPKELAGVRVIVAGIQAALFYVSPGQINFQFPAAIRAGSSATVFVLRNGELSDSIRASYRIAAPQVFVDSKTMLPILVHRDRALVTPERPARPGDVLEVFFTGIGLVNDTPPDGVAATGTPLSRTLFTGRATLGGAALTVLFTGLAPNYVGLGQANVVLPASLPAGSTLPLVLSIDTGFAVLNSAPVNVPVAP